MFSVFGRLNGQARTMANSGYGGTGVVPAKYASETSGSGGQRPKTWVFKGYQLMRDSRSGDYGIYENRDRFDPVLGRHVPNLKPIRTEIALPSSVERSWVEERGTALVAVCDAIRRRLDQAGHQGGLKLLFDRQPSEEDAGVFWQPKWKYQVEPNDFGASNLRIARRMEERLLVVLPISWSSDIKRIEDPDGLPQDLHELAVTYWNAKLDGRNVLEYWKQPSWRDWFGKAIQRKREQVISEELTAWLTAHGSVTTAVADEWLAEAAVVARNLLALFLRSGNGTNDLDSLRRQISDSTLIVLRNLLESRGQATDYRLEAAVTAAVEKELLAMLPAANVTAADYVILLERDASGSLEAALSAGVRRLISQTVTETPGEPLVERIANTLVTALCAHRKTEALEYDPAKATLRVRDEAKLKATLAAFVARSAAN